MAIQNMTKDEVQTQINEIIIIMISHHMQMKIITAKRISLIPILCLIMINQMKLEQNPLETTVEITETKNPDHSNTF